MLKDILGVVEKTNTRPVLIAFVALSATTLYHGNTLLKDPFSEQALAIPIAVLFAYGVVWYWCGLIHRLNASLSNNDIASFGPLVGCSILAFCLLVTFSYLSAHPQGLTFTLLGESNFIRLATLYLLAAESIKIHR